MSIPKQFIPAVNKTFIIKENNLDVDRVHMHAIMFVRK